MLARWTGVVQDDAGNALVGASIEVRGEETGALVPLYSDRAGTSALGNPFTAGDATFGFHVEGGAYRITARAGAFERVWRFVAIGTAQEYDFIAIASALQAGFYPTATLAALNAYVPEEGQSIAGVVLNDPNPANNGYYIRVGSAWVRQRGLPDTLSMLQVTGGTADAVEAIAGAGIDPAAVAAYVIDVDEPNTGPVTLSVNGGPALPVLDREGNEFAAGQFVGRIFISNEGTQYREIVGSDIVARAYAEAERAADAADVSGAAATAAVSAANRAEQAASDVENPVSYAPQTLAPEQQEQARENIGVGTVGTADFPETPAGRFLNDEGDWTDPPESGYTQANIVGTVSQTGGVPTGAIIERGENANGKYVRFADGTQICWHRAASAVTTNVALAAPIYVSPGTGVEIFTFPAAFVATPEVGTATSRPAGGTLGWGLADQTTATGTLIRVFSYSNAAGGTVPGYVAAGRWF